MSALRARLEVAAFQMLLTGLGAAMAVASLQVDRLRRQITRDLVIEIGSEDGARQQFRLHARTRRLTLARSATMPDCALTFPSAREGLRALLSRRTIGRIVEGMNTGATRIDGNPALMLWFHGLTRVIAPIGSTRRPRHEVPIPAREPEHEAVWAQRIVREPPVAELSRDWPAAWAAREKLWQVRAPGGEQLPRG